MKRYRFRLEQVLRVRRIEEEQAKASLVAANRHVTETEALLNAKIERYASITNPVGTRSVNDFLTARAGHEAAAAAVVSAGAALDDARRGAEDARHGWMLAASRVTALENLHARRRAEHAAEAEHEAAMEIDDLVTSRYGRQLLAA